MRLTDGTTKQESWATGLLDTKENRAPLDRLKQYVAACVRAGKDPRPELEKSRADFDVTPAGATPVLALGPTLRSYYAEWYASRRDRVRPEQARDYRRHMENYVLPALGDRLLADLRPQDVHGLQAELLATTSKKTGKPLSEKFVKNMLIGTFRAMMRAARACGLVLCDPFIGLEWERWEHPDPDPFEAAERDAILEWFRTHRFTGRGAPHGVLAHPHYYAYLHLLFWHGARPSIRPRGLYATKDTAVTIALATRREDVLLWLVNQTGVAVETLRRHYGKFITKPDRGMWERLDPGLARRRLAVVA